MEIVPIKKLRESQPDCRERLAAMCPYDLDSDEALTWFECLGTEGVES